MQKFWLDAELFPEVDEYDDEVAQLVFYHKVKQEREATY